MGQRSRIDDPNRRIVKGGDVRLRQNVLTIAVLSIALIPTQAIAQSEDSGFKWKFSGFGSLGMARSDTDEVEYLRDFSQPVGVKRKWNGRLDSRLGIQLTSQMGEHFSASLQAVSKYRYDHTYTPQVTWAFLGWTPHPDFQVRAGRVGFDVFMNADSRDVGYSYLWARPSRDYYGTLPISYLDGMDMTYTPLVGESVQLKFKGYYGLTQEKIPSGAGDPLSLKKGRLGGVVAEAQGLQWRFRLAYGNFHTQTEWGKPLNQLIGGLEQFSQVFPSLNQAVEDLSMKDKRFNFYSAGISYEGSNFQTQWMGARYTGNSAMSPDSWSGFGSVGYRMGRVVPYAFWSRLVTDRPTVNLDALNLVQPNPGNPASIQQYIAAQTLLQALPRATKGTQADQVTYGGGFRIDLPRGFCLKFQADYIKTKGTAGLWRNPTPEWDNKATVFSTVLDFVF